MYSNLVKYVPNRKPPMGAVLNPYLPINRGLAAFWPGWEGSGNIVSDLSGNGNMGTFQGIAPSWTAGKFGSAINLPGTNEHIDYPVFDSGPEITVIAWVSSPSWPNDAGIISHMRTMLEVDASGTALRWFPDIVVASVSQAFTFATDTWYQIAATQDSSDNYVLYVNGISIKSGSAEPMSRTLTNHFIGKFQSSSWFHNGLIDLPMIYGRVLSASEIAELYREPFCGFRWPNIIELASYVAAVGGVPRFRRRRAG